MAIQYNTPTWISGDTESLEFIIADDTGVPLDITGYTGRMQIRAGGNGSSLAEAIAVLDVPSSSMKFTFTPTQTAKLRDVGVINLPYDAEVTSATGIVTTEVYGTIPIQKDITR